MILEGGTSQLVKFVNPLFSIYFMLEIMFCNSSVSCSLFHVVVENDEISTLIIRRLNAEKGGRVTFIPLNRVKAPHVNYPQSSDVIPLLKKLKFSRNYTPAFAQVRDELFFFLLSEVA